MIEVPIHENIQPGDWCHWYGLDGFVRRKLQIREILEQFQDKHAKTRSNRTIEFISTGGGLFYVKERQKRVRFFRKVQK
jgi:hypothetical protein